VDVGFLGQLIDAAVALFYLHAEALTDPRQHLQDRRQLLLGISSPNG
jgi:hypothetical protein